MLTVGAGCEKQSSNPMSAAETDQRTPTGVQTLSDTIMDNWNNGQTFLELFKNGSHPDVSFEDNVDSCKLILFFNGKRYKDCQYTSFRMGRFRPELLGGWVNPGCYLLLVQTQVAYMYQGKAYDFFLISGEVSTKISQLPKTSDYGYFTGGIFEPSNIHIDGVKKFNGDIIFHGIEYIADEAFCKMSMQNNNFANCNRRYNFTPGNEHWTWQW